MRYSISAMLGLLSLLNPCFAQPAAEAPPVEATTTQTFSDAVEAYKESLIAVEELRGQYQTAPADQRPAINDKVKELLTRAQSQLRAMVTAGVAEYKTNPGTDKMVEETLLTVARHYAKGFALKNTAGNYSGGDQYELALPVIEALIAGGVDDPELQVLGFVSAVNANQFDIAEQRLGTIREDKLIDQGPPGEDEATVGIWGTAAKYAETFDVMRARWQKEQKIREAEAAADNLPRVKIETSKGTIVIELFEDQAPIATANFLTLVKKGFYDGVVFHRVLQGFMAQGGDPTGTGSGGPGYSIACECNEPDARQHFRGTLSMAHAGKDTGGSQFFLTFVPTDFLDGRHTAFGRVIEGMEVLGELQRIDPQGEGQKAKPDKMVKATVIRDRGGDYDFPKLPER